MDNNTICLLAIVRRTCTYDNALTYTKYQNAFFIYSFIALVVKGKIKGSFFMLALEDPEIMRLTIMRHRNNMLRLNVV